MLPDRMIVAVALVAAVGCRGRGGGDGRAATCERLARQSAGMIDGLGRSLGGATAADDPDVQAKVADLRTRCLAWPADVFACMRPGADPGSPRCQAALATVTGVVAAGADAVPDGPPVAATATLGRAPTFGGYQAVVTDDGTLITLEAEQVAAWTAAGAPGWRVPLAHAAWMQRLTDGSLAVGVIGPDAVVALDPATGAERWRALMPAPPDDDSGASAQAAVEIGPRLLVGLADARFVWIDPRACRAGAASPGCVAPAAALPDETLDTPTLLAAPGGDGVVLGEAEQVRLLTLTGATLAAIHVRDTFGGVAVTGTRVAVTLDDELVLFDLSACAAAAPVVLPRKSGRLYLRGDGECDACVVPPRGCVVARVELDGVDAAPPRLLADGSVVVTLDDGLARVTAAGARRWVSDVAAFGPVVEVGDELIVLAATVGDDLAAAPVRVVGLDAATGKARWKRALSVTAPMVVSLDDATVAAAGGWIVAGYQAGVAWLRRP
ncbi:MAG: PQQ-binding-like beta-propeller repeat protein [Kofleriaceae bacterium]